MLLGSCQEGEPGRKLNRRFQNSSSKEEKVAVVVVVAIVVAVGLVGGEILRYCMKILGQQGNPNNSKVTAQCRKCNSLASIYGTLNTL